eukprot:TRINITY_DN8726_c0_g1_i1.p1 TRINITY_DN8726_c0_g1~~TRINITY_DN8726_c0_g1_i1.p1  ORF type:complete len:282 (-),score=64.11 TRINITY_DN8726_c0_g1_i1:319-1164(-)
MGNCKSTTELQQEHRDREAAEHHGRVMASPLLDLNVSLVGGPDHRIEARTLETAGDVLLRFAPLCSIPEDCTRRLQLEFSDEVMAYECTLQEAGVETEATLKVLGEPELRADLDAVGRARLGGLDLFAAVRRGELEMVRLYARCFPGGLDRLDQTERKSALHLAAQADFCDAVAVLLEAGADANVQSGGQWTPLHHAAFHTSSGSAQLLLAHGAVVDPLDRDGRTPLVLLRESPRALDDLYVLERTSSAFGNVYALESALLEAGAAPVGRTLLQKHTPVLK